MATVIQSPVLDIVAVGLVDGSIFLYHLKEDLHILQFHQPGASAVHVITFRTGLVSSSRGCVRPCASLDGVAHMATGSADGDIHIWDLDAKRLLNTVKRAHDKAISSLHYIPQQSVLLSAGHDNSLKVIPRVTGEGLCLRARTH